MKVSAEEYLGMLVAVETGLSIGEEADLSYKQARFANIIEQLADVPSVSTKVFVSEGHANELYLDIDWDEGVIKLSRQALVDALRENTPAVEVRLFFFSGDRIQLSATVMEDGQDKIVGRIIRKILLAHT
jgi:hypothetical protein